MKAKKDCDTCGRKDLPPHSTNFCSGLTFDACTNRGYDGWQPKKDLNKGVIKSTIKFVTIVLCITIVLMFLILSRCTSTIQYTQNIVSGDLLSDCKVHLHTQAFDNKLEGDWYNNCIYSEWECIDGIDSEIDGVKKSGIKRAKSWIKRYYKR